MEIWCDTHGVTEDHGFDVALTLDIDAAHKPNQRPRMCAMVRPCRIDCLAHQVQNGDYPVFEMRDNDIASAATPFAGLVMHVMVDWGLAVTARFQEGGSASSGLHRGGPIADAPVSISPPHCPFGKLACSGEPDRIPGIRPFAIMDDPEKSALGGKPVPFQVERKYPLTVSGQAIGADDLRAGIDKALLTRPAPPDPAVGTKVEIAASRVAPCLFGAAEQQQGTSCDFRPGRLQLNEGIAPAPDRIRIQREDRLRAQ